jgi:hypothetical protein
MRKIIVPIMALMITFGLLGVGTYGVFALPEDTNIIDHGQLALDVQGRNTVNQVYFFGNIKPGDFNGWDGAPNTDGITWKVKNTGSLDGSLEISIEGIDDNSSGLSTQITPRLRINGSLVSESSNLTDLPVFKRALASGEEIKVDIAWKFKETAGNQYQGISTKLNVKFYITAPSPAVSPDNPITPTTPLVTPAIGVAALTEGTTTGGISVLAFTGVNPVIPLTGITLLLIGFFALVLEANRKRKMKLKNSIHKNI